MYNISMISTNIELIFHDIPIESPVTDDFFPPKGAHLNTQFRWSIAGAPQR